jgi:Na+/H+-translocating membrane pyrophosphatase
MTSSLKTILLAGTAALAFTLGAVAAHAGGYEDLLVAQQAAALAAAAGDRDSDPITEAIEAAATELEIDSVLGSDSYDE